MNDLRTAAQQALEALTPFVRGSWTPGLAVQAAAAMDRLKAALAEPQSTHSAACYQWHHKCAIAEVERLRAALAEPAQEPVKQCMAHGECFGGECIYQRPAEPVQDPDSPERRCGGPGRDGTCCQPVQEPVAFKDAPERIWLQACEDDHCEVPFCEHNEITWCAEQQNPLDVQYVRADLAAPPKLPAEPQGCDHCEHPLSAGTRETLRLVDELALCAELKREYQEQFAQAAVQRDVLLEALKELTGHTNKRFTGGVWDRARAAIKAVEEGK